MPRGHGDAGDTAIASAKVVGVVTAFNGGRVSPVIDGMGGENEGNDGVESVLSFRMCMSSESWCTT